MNVERIVEKLVESPLPLSMPLIVSRLMTAENLLQDVASVIPLVANDPDGEVRRLVALFEPIKAFLRERVS